MVGLSLIESLILLCIGTSNVKYSSLFLVPFILFCFIVIESRRTFYNEQSIKILYPSVLMPALCLVLLYNQYPVMLWGLTPFHAVPDWVTVIFVILWQWSLIPSLALWTLSRMESAAKWLQFKGRKIVWFVIIFVFFFALKENKISADGLDWINTTRQNEWWLYLREVYSMLLFRISYLFHRVWGGDAGLSISMVSVLCGVIFFLQLPALLRHFSITSRRDKLMFYLGIIATYGLIQQFCGHIEVYSLFLIAVLFYLRLTLDFIENKIPFWLLGSYFALILGIHIAGIWLLPSLLLLPLLKRKYRMNLSIMKEYSLGFSAMLLTGVILLLPIIMIYYDGNIGKFWARGFLSVTDTPDHRVFLPLSIIFSSAHLLDLVNLFFYNFGVHIFLLIYLLGRGEIHKNWRIKDTVLLSMIVPTLIFAFTYRLGRGAMKDWDSFSLLTLLIALFALRRLFANSEKFSPYDYHNIFIIELFFMGLTIILILSRAGWI